MSAHCKQCGAAWIGIGGCRFCDADQAHAANDSPSSDDDDCRGNPKAAPDVSAELAALRAEVERLRAENQLAWNKAGEYEERARHAETERDRLRAVLAETKENVRAVTELIPADAGLALSRARKILAALRARAAGATMKPTEEQVRAIGAARDMALEAAAKRVGEIAACDPGYLMSEIRALKGKPSDDDVDRLRAVLADLPTDQPWILQAKRALRARAGEPR